MGAALAAAVLQQGHDVVIVSGPVGVDYPAGAQVIPVVTTDDMLNAAGEIFPECDGAIGAAAPCDYKPLKVSDQKLSKTGEPLALELIETPDVIAVLGQGKRSDQWVVGFALETDDRHFRATVKLQKKCCDLMVSNGPEAIDAADNNVELLGPDGRIIEKISGSKQHVANRLIHQIHHRLILSCPQQPQ
ncbi:Coenzyme A biosynthesis bifunctional protein CoaBC [Allorhodopirellula heiligendammensis]|uniref:Coenzyme A biosynthesis bifunctional protein CoaBC n=2 Tax=Allorhodopirellula heiligendammensis TaxID=2714739 RepID=A0A5C6C5E9_9BACT|nr:Coenzyme A biosynthesis bifunctional protein CoaBC [Allorhodopirellula heiligendammensis]